MGGTTNAKLIEKSFYLFGFDITKKKQLEDAVVKSSGKISTVVNQQTTHFVTSFYELQHMKGVIDELIGSFKISIVDEDFIWNEIGNEEMESSYSVTNENNIQTLGTNESVSEVKTETNDGDLDSRWMDGRRVVADISQEHLSYKYTPNGEFHYLLHRIYNSKEKINLSAENYEKKQVEDKKEYDLALGSNMLLNDVKFNEVLLNINPGNYEEFYNLNKDRIKWQNMLSSVLNGEVIESEKNRINITINAHQHETEHYQRWIGIRARLHNCTIVEEKRQLGKDRLNLNAIVEEVKNFRCQPTESSSALDQVDELIRKVEWAESLYPTRKALLKAKPAFKDPKFERYMYAINSWSSLTRSLQQQMNVLIEWTGSDTLQVSSDHTKETPSFIECILKGDSLQNTLEKRALTILKDLLLTSKADVEENFDIYIQLNLAGSVVNVELLISLPLNLVMEGLKLRLQLSNRLKKPSLIVIDQMLDDLRQSLYLACRTKEEYEIVIAPGPGWEMRQCVHSSFDSILLQSLKFYFKLLRWKIKLVSKSATLKEIDILDSEWGFVVGLIDTFKDSKQEIVSQFCSLSSKLLERSIIKFNSQLGEISSFDQVKCITWLFESFRLRVRKQMRFVEQLTARFENATEYAIVDSLALNETINLLTKDHVLVNTGASSSKGSYVFLNLTLANNPQSIADVLQTGFSKEEDDNIEPNYMLIIASQQPIKWEGQVLDYEVELPDMDLKENRVRLISNSPSTLTKNKQHFQFLFEDTGLIVCQPRRANLLSIDRELCKIKRKSFKIANAILDSVTYIRQTVHGIINADLIENCFIFASDFCQKVLKTMDIPMRAKLTLRLINLATDWVNFVFNDCVATDRKTFKWAVIALEFAMLMTAGNNVVLLDEPDFENLRSSVAGCMLLLISHIDIQGIRSATENASTLANIGPKAIDTPHSQSEMVEDSRNKSRYSMLEKLEMLEQRRTEDLYNKCLVGRILDNNRIEDRTLTFLAAYADNLSFQWQLGKFLGAGAFGTVYSATNLDSGEIMAVKELRFPDPSQLMALYKPIKEEMSVMKMLNHPNIVSYYGIEVHRDRVFIFMEYCQGGSLSGLLEHGRIEDENIVKIYTYQMLQGLEYLHSRNVLHRDIKPDNLLLNHNGVIKFVDFGAAKVIARSKTLAATAKPGMNKSLTGTPMYMAPEVITGANKGTKGAQDIWAVGCCVLEMVTGKRPWSNLDNEWAIMYHAASGHPPLPEPNQISNLGMKFILDCFRKVPEERPTAKQLLKHPWLKDIDLELIARPSSTSQSCSDSVSSRNSSLSYSSQSSDTLIYNPRQPFPIFHRADSGFSSDNGSRINTINTNSSWNLDSPRATTLNWKDKVGVSNDSLDSGTLVESPTIEKTFDLRMPTTPPFTS